MNGSSISSAPVDKEKLKALIASGDSSKFDSPSVLSITSADSVLINSTSISNQNYAKIGSFLQILSAATVNVSNSIIS